MEKDTVNYPCGTRGSPLLLCGSGVEKQGTGRSLHGGARRANRRTRTGSWKARGKRGARLGIGARQQDRDLELARDNKIESGAVIVWPQDEEPSPPSTAAAQLTIATLKADNHALTTANNQISETNAKLYAMVANHETSIDELKTQLATLKTANQGFATQVQNQATHPVGLLSPNGNGQARR